MSGLFDYLDWRGDIPFSWVPFSSVDNLILAELAYTDFDGVVPESGVAVTIREVRDRYFELHTREEILARTNFSGQAPMLLDRLAESKRFESLCLSDYLNVVDTDRDEQIAAVTYRIGDGMYYAAFRGTDNTIVGWKEDFELSYRTTAGQQRAAQYLNEVFAGREGVLLTGGHSKGGNFAVYASAFCLPGIRKRISRIYSNDGPGFREEVADTEAFREILPKVESIVPEDAIIGTLFSPQYRQLVVKSDAEGIWQHDPLSWQVLGSRFVEAEERSQGSRFFERTIQKWLEDIDDETRASFVNSLFSFFETAGAGTLDDVKNRLFGTINDMIRALWALPKEKQTEFRQVVTGLVGSTIRNYLETGKEKRITEKEKRIRKKPDTADLTE